jgi:hypothetical protein
LLGRCLDIRLQNQLEVRAIPENGYGDVRPGLECLGRVHIDCLAHDRQPCSAAVEHRDHARWYNRAIPREIAKLLPVA